jgi:hypothetical protein
MVVGYFAESKGLVGCTYKKLIGLKNEGQVVVLKLNFESAL